MQITLEQAEAPPRSMIYGESVASVLHAVREWFTPGLIGLHPAEIEKAFAVLDTVAQAGEWGRRMAPGTAQGIAIHKEYKGVSACLVEIDTRPETTGRSIRDAVTGPRVTRVT